MPAALHATPRIHRRAIVVGSGIAGLTAALELGDCAVVTKTRLGEGASRWAQGGIAAALGPDDDPARHAADTLAVAGGLADPEVVARLTAGAPDRIAWLQQLGAEFDAGGEASGPGDGPGEGAHDSPGEGAGSRSGPRLALGREAGHARRRIVRAHGDATGAAVMRALIAEVEARPDLEVVADTVAVDLLRAGPRVVGVLAVDAAGGRHALLAPAVVLATGGIGRAYAHTTNPAEATGDGLAMAARAGAVIRDPEFVQFHPTVLDVERDPRPLLTEALRGEGATLVDVDGRRYLLDVHPDAELAPRDVVARASWQALQRGPIHLDARVVGEDFPRRFPTVFDAARQAGLDPRVDLLPVTPSQHYHMGGVRADVAGRTSLPGLYVCGEVASTGLHGANRLASNSLVEGLVGGAQVAWAVRAEAACVVTRDVEVAAGADEVRAVGGGGAGGGGGVAAGGAGADGAGAACAVAALRRLMWQAAGLVRDEAGLRAGLAGLARLEPELRTDPIGRNLAVVADLVLTAALQRRESRGGHTRADFPDLQPGPPRHTELTPDPVTRRPVVLDGQLAALP